MATVYRKKDNFWFNNSSGSVTLTASNGVKKDSCSWTERNGTWVNCH